MDAGRLPDWTEPHAETGEPRSGRDRRTQQRRAPRRPFDPLFAATLVNHVAAPAADYTRGYPAAKPARTGLVVNVRA